MNKTTSPSHLQGQSSSVTHTVVQPRNHPSTTARSFLLAPHHEQFPVGLVKQSMQAYNLHTNTTTSPAELKAHQDYEVEEMLRHVVVSDAPQPLLSLLQAQGWKGERHVDILGSPLSLLHVAVDTGPRTVKALLQKGLNMDHLCCRSQQQSQQQSRDAAAAACPEYATTELHLAAAFGRTKVLRLLLENGANPNLVGGRGESVLMAALDPVLSSRIAACVQTLLDHDADPNLSAPGDQEVPLLRAMKIGVWSAAELLLWAGADPNIASPTSQETALFWARSPALVSSLLRCGANIHHQDARGRTALHHMASSTRRDVQNDNDDIVSAMRLLLQAGADPNRPDDQGTTPLHCVCAQWNKGLFDLLTTEFKGDVQRVDHAGRTTLHCANGNLVAIQALVASGVNARATCRLGRIFLHEYVLRRYSAKQEEPFLDLAHFAGTPVDVNATDIHGWTPLHYASFLGHADTISWLIESGANVHACDTRGRTPVQLTGLSLVLLSSPMVDVVPVVDEIMDHGGLVAKLTVSSKERRDGGLVAPKSGLEFMSLSPGTTECAVQTLISAGGKCFDCDHGGNGSWTLACRASQASLSHVFSIIQAASYEGLFG